MMRNFVCPKCGTKAKALALAAGHRCPSNQNKWVSFLLVEQKDESVSDETSKAMDVPAVIGGRS